MSREEKRLMQLVEELQRENAMLRDRAGSASHSRFDMQEAAGQAENQLQQALDNAGLAVWEWDVAGKVVHTSSSFSALLGAATAATAAAKSWHAQDLWGKVHADHAAPLQAAIVRVLKLQDPSLVMEICLTHNAQAIWIECTGAVTQLDMMGRCERMMGICRNITQRKPAQPQTQDAPELYLQTQDASDEQGNLQQDAPLEQLPFALGPWLQDVIDGQRPAAHSKGLQLELLIDDTLPQEVIGDAGRLQQVVAHLVDNAIKFTHQGSVQVVLQLAGDTAEGIDLLLEVIDTGMGMEPEQQQVIFDVLTQPDSASALSHAGSGLSICAKLVATMGGNLQLASAPGEGSRLMALIPLGISINSTPEREIAPQEDRPHYAATDAQAFSLPEPYEASDFRQSAVTEAMPLSTDIGPPPPVDRERMLKKLGGSHTALQEVASTFRRDLRDLLSSIFKALKLSDWQSLESDAHILKVSLLDITAEATAHYAHDLELAAKTQDTRGAQHAFDQLSEHAKPVYEAVAKWQS